MPRGCVCGKNKQICGNLPAAVKTPAEISRMPAGDKVTETTRRQAEELIAEGLRLRQK